MSSKMNDSNDRRDGRLELGILCYYKVNVLPVSNIVFLESGLKLFVNMHL